MIERRGNMFRVTRTLFGAFGTVGFSFHAVGRAAMPAAVLTGLLAGALLPPLAADWPFR